MAVIVKIQIALLAVQPNYGIAIQKIHANQQAVIGVLMPGADGASHGYAEQYKKHAVIE